MEKKGNPVDFSETIVIYDLKLATDDRSDKKFLSVDIKTVSPGGCMPPPPHGEPLGSKV